MKSRYWQACAPSENSRGESVLSLFQLLVAPGIPWFVATLISEWLCLWPILPPLPPHLSVKYPSVSLIWENLSLDLKPIWITHCIIIRDLIAVIPEWPSGFPFYWREHSPTFTKRAFAGPAALHFKANNQARLVERKVCLISDSGNWAVGVADINPKPDPPLLQPVGPEPL